ncbi:MAG: ParB N-terminal domain-containing protein [Janthinobacterium lividum]
MTLRPFPATATGRAVRAVPASGLVPHEEHDEHRALRLARHIRRVGVWTAPLVVERDSLVVMDGHHRLRAAQALGLLVLPAVLLSYEDGEVTLEAWRAGEHWSPAAVLSSGRSGRLLPRKTTRHLFQPAIGAVAIPLAWLAGKEARPGSARTRQRPEAFGNPLLK